MGSNNSTLKVKNKGKKKEVEDTPILEDFDEVEPPPGSIDHVVMHIDLLRKCHKGFSEFLSKLSNNTSEWIVNCSKERRQQLTAIIEKFRAVTVSTHEVVNKIETVSLKWRNQLKLLVQYKRTSQSDKISRNKLASLYKPEDLEKEISMEQLSNLLQQYTDLIALLDQEIRAINKDRAVSIKKRKCFIGLAVASAIAVVTFTSLAIAFSAGVAAAPVIAALVGASQLMSQGVATAALGNMASKLGAMKKKLETLKELYCKSITQVKKTETSLNFLMHSALRSSEEVKGFKSSTIHFIDVIDDDILNEAVLNQGKLASVVDGLKQHLEQHSSILLDLTSLEVKMRYKN